jgi:hypothetical protein
VTASARFREAVGTQVENWEDNPPELTRQEIEAKLAAFEKRFDNPYPTNDEGKPIPPPPAVDKKTRRRRRRKRKGKQ